MTATASFDLPGSEQSPDRLRPPHIRARTHDVASTAIFLQQCTAQAHTADVAVETLNSQARVTSSAPLRKLAREICSALQQRGGNQNQVIDQCQGYTVACRLNGSREANLAGAGMSARASRQVPGRRTYRGNRICNLGVRRLPA